MVLNMNTKLLIYYNWIIKKSRLTQKPCIFLCKLRDDDVVQIYLFFTGAVIIFICPFKVKECSSL